MKNRCFSMVFHCFLGIEGLVFHVWFKKNTKKQVCERIVMENLNRTLNKAKKGTNKCCRTRKKGPQDQPRRLQRGTVYFDPGSDVAMFGVQGPPKDQRSLKKQPCWLQSRLQDWKDWRLDAWSLTRQGAWRIFIFIFINLYTFINISTGKPNKKI